jgi:hypothetical protein
MTDRMDGADRVPIRRVRFIGEERRVVERIILCTVLWETT